MNWTRVGALDSLVTCPRCHCEIKHDTMRHGCPVCRQRKAERTPIVLRHQLYCNVCEMRVYHDVVVVNRAATAKCRDCGAERGA
jgi:hypothetical protein